MGKVWPQYLLTLICNIGPLTFGLHVGWLATLNLTAESETTPFGTQLSNEQISWLAALPTGAILLGSPIFGWLLQRFGRKTACLAANLPSVVVFAIFLVSSNVNAAYAARFIAGIASAGVLIVTPVYVSECVDDVQRGFLCGVSALFINLGIAIVFGIGAYFPYSIVNTLCLSISAIFLIGYMWLPESPVHLIRVGKPEDAVKCMKKLRGGDEERAQLDLDVISAALKISEGPKRLGIRGVLISVKMRKALLLGFGIMTSQQLSGITAALTYITQILNDSNCYPSRSAVTAIIGVVQFISSGIGPLLLAFFGRKTILVVSGVIMSSALAVFSVHLYLNQTDPSLVPTVSLLIYFVSYSIGFGTVPFVLLPEIVPPESRGVVVGIVGAWLGALSFLVLKFFPMMTMYMTMWGSFTSFTVCSILGTLFIHLCLFETRNKSPVEIDSLLLHGWRKSKSQET